MDFEAIYKHVKLLIFFSNDFHIKSPKCYQGRFSQMAAHSNVCMQYLLLSYDVASGSEITPCIKICKPLVVYRFSGNVMTSITTLCT